MRVISLLLAGGLLASCTTAPQPTRRAADKQAELQQLLVGKVAQRPISCLPHYQSGDMRVIDEDTIAFRDGARRTFVARLKDDPVSCAHELALRMGLLNREVRWGRLASGIDGAHAIKIDGRRV